MSYFIILPLSTSLEKRYRNVTKKINRTPAQFIDIWMVIFIIII